MKIIPFILRNIVREHLKFTHNVPACRFVILLLLFIITINHSSFSQINFEHGYFIDNNGKRTDCLIKNVGWLNNPTKFQYKPSENAEVQVTTINNVREFSVSSIKFKRFVTKIDRSSNQMSKLGYTKDPEFNEEVLWLKVLVEGDANLLSYELGNVKRYFYYADSTEIIPLIYKIYLNQYKEVRTNNSFKQLLWLSLNCHSMNRSDAENTDYNSKDLVRYFKKYNACINPDFKVTSENSSADFFNLNIRPGLMFSKFSFQNTTSPDFLSAKFGTKTSYSLGIEIEFILPFNKNKWAIIIEPTYQVYSTNAQLNTTTSSQRFVNLDYESIEFPFGLRHYFFVGNSSKIFVNASYLFDKPLNSKITGFPNLFLNPSQNLNFGLGYNYRNKYSVEFNYSLSRDPLIHWTQWAADYSSFSVIFGYNIF